MFERSLNKVILYTSLVKFYHVLFLFFHLLIGEYSIVHNQNKYGTGNIDCPQMIPSPGLTKD
nr:MAG TPA: hypothetical protein [Bacteriophage sp.]